MSIEKDYEKRNELIVKKVRELAKVSRSPFCVMCLGAVDEEKNCEKCGNNTHLIPCEFLSTVRHLSETWSEDEVDQLVKRGSAVTVDFGLRYYWVDDLELKLENWFGSATGQAEFIIGNNL